MIKNTKYIACLHKDFWISSQYETINIIEIDWIKYELLAILDENTEEILETLNWDNFIIEIDEINIKTWEIKWKINEITWKNNQKESELV